MSVSQSLVKKTHSFYMLLIPTFIHQLINHLFIDLSHGISQRRQRHPFILVPRNDWSNGCSVSKAVAQPLRTLNPTRYGWRSIFHRFHQRLSARSSTWVWRDRPLTIDGEPFLAKDNPSLCKCLPKVVESVPVCCTIRNRSLCHRLEDNFANKSCWKPFRWQEKYVRMFVFS